VAVVQYSTVQYSTAQHSTVQYSAVQYSTVQYSTVQYSIVQYSRVHIYTQTIHRTTQNKQYIEQHNNYGRVRSVPCLGELYTGIALHLREKHGKTSVRVAASKNT